MTDPTATFFEELGTRGHEPRLKVVTGTVRFDITQDGSTQHWWLRIDHGALRVSTGDAGPDGADADCVIEAGRPLFDGIATGRVNAMAAMLRGDLLLAGDPELLVSCQRLFPTAPAPRPGEPAEVGGGRSS